jgi:hypothetical protein
MVVKWIESKPLFGLLHVINGLLGHTGHEKNLLPLLEF